MLEHWRLNPPLPVSEPHCYGHPCNRTKLQNRVQPAALVVHTSPQLTSPFSSSRLPQNLSSSHILLPPAPPALCLPLIPTLLQKSSTRSCELQNPVSITSPSLYPELPSSIFPEYPSHLLSYPKPALSSTCTQC